MSKNLTLSLVLLAFILGIGAGYALTPEYAQMQKDRAQGMMELGSADSTLDLRYIDGMIAHHQSAIYMLKQAQEHSKRPEIQDLATAVIKADEAGIAQLYQYKKEWYGNTREVTRFPKVQLGTADENFDLRLLNALLEHHAEAITVAREVKTKSKRNEVLNTANEVTQVLTANSQQLKQWRKEWYGVE